MAVARKRKKIGTSHTEQVNDFVSLLGELEEEDEDDEDTLIKKQKQELVVFDSSTISYSLTSEFLSTFNDNDDFEAKPTAKKQQKAPLPKYVKQMMDTKQLPSMEDLPKSYVVCFWAATNGHLYEEPYRGMNKWDKYQELEVIMIVAIIQNRHEAGDVQYAIFVPPKKVHKDDQTDNNNDDDDADNDDDNEEEEEEADDIGFKSNGWMKEFREMLSRAHSIVTWSAKTQYACLRKHVVVEGEFEEQPMIMWQMSTFDLDSAIGKAGKTRAPKLRELLNVNHIDLPTNMTAAGSLYQMNDHAGLLKNVQSLVFAIYFLFEHIRDTPNHTLLIPPKPNSSKQTIVSLAADYTRYITNSRSEDVW